MNRKLLLAGLLAAFTAIVHIAVGTPEVAGPLLRAPWASELRLLLYACWHLVSCALALSALALLAAARNKELAGRRALVAFISLMWAAFGLVFVLIALPHGGVPMLLKLPQWILLLPVGLLGGWAVRAAPAR